MYKFKHLFFKNRLYCAFIPGLDPITKYNSNDYVQPKTGMERVRAILKTNKNGELEQELQTAWNFSLFNGFIAGMYGGFRHGKQAFDEFIYRNETTKFKNPYEAKKQLNEYIAKNFAKHFLIYGTKGLLFSGLLIYTVIFVKTYRGKQGILEYVIAGTLCGALARINHGLHGAVSGALLACTMTTAIGVVLFLVSKLTKFSFLQDNTTENRKLHESRQRAIAKEKRQYVIPEQSKPNEQDKISSLISQESSKKE